MNINNMIHTPYTQRTPSISNVSLNIPTNSSGLDIESQTSPVLFQHFDIVIQSEGTLSTNGTTPKMAFKNKENLSLEKEFQVGIEILITNMNSKQTGTVVFSTTESPNHFDYTISTIIPCTSRLPN